MLFVSFVAAVGALTVGDGLTKINIPMSSWFAPYEATWETGYARSFVYFADHSAKQFLQKNAALAANYSFDFTFYNVFGNLDKQWYAVLDALVAQPELPDYWLGPELTDSVRLTSLILGLYKIPQMHSNIDGAWLDRAAYPYSYTVMGSNLAPSYASILQALNLQSYSFVGVEDNMQEEEPQLLSAILSQCDIELIGARLFYPSEDKAAFGFVNEYTLEYITNEMEPIEDNTMVDALSNVFDVNINPARVVFLKHTGGHSANEEAFMQRFIFKDLYNVVRIDELPHPVNFLHGFSALRALAGNPNSDVAKFKEELLGPGGDCSPSTDGFKSWYSNSTPSFSLQDAAEPERTDFESIALNVDVACNAWQDRLFDYIALLFRTFQRMMDAGHNLKDQELFVAALTSGWQYEGLTATFSMQGIGYALLQVALYTRPPEDRNLTGPHSDDPCAVTTSEGVDLPSTCAFWDASPTLESFFIPAQPPAPYVSVSFAGVSLTWEMINLYGAPFVAQHLQAKATGEVWEDVLKTTSATVSSGAIQLPPATYQFRVGTESVGGTTWSDSTDPFVVDGGCDSTPCGANAVCQPDNSCACEPGKEYLAPAEDGKSCDFLFTPCAEYTCLGSFGTCSQASGICECQSGTILQEMATATPEQRADTNVYLQAAYDDAGEVSGGWKTCVQDLATATEAREFWTFSLWLSAWGVLASMWLLWEFFFNAQLKHPNTMMQAFVAFAVPDVVLSSLNFVVYVVQLINQQSLGSPTGEGGFSESGCIAVAFIMYFIVVCTYFAPVMVALFLFLKFNSVTKGHATFSVGTPVILAVCVGLPLVLGTGLAAGTYATDASDGQSVLGSYRGLYCFIRRWDESVTSVVFILFVLAVCLIVVFYLLTAMKVSAVVKSSGGASKASAAILKRGILLTCNFVLWWIWFVVTAGISSSGNPITNVRMDYIGAILINAQPIVDAFVIIWSLPNVRQALLERHLSQMGLSSFSSSSSSSSSSSEVEEDDDKAEVCFDFNVTSTRLNAFEFTVGVRTEPRLENTYPEFVENCFYAAELTRSPFIGGGIELDREQTPSGAKYQAYQKSLTSGARASAAAAPGMAIAAVYVAWLTARGLGRRC